MRIERASGGWRAGGATIVRGAHSTFVADRDGLRGVTWMDSSGGVPRLRCVQDVASVVDLPSYADRWPPLMGYGAGRDATIAYALDHDLVHVWVGEEVYGGPSPTLLAVARGDPPPGANDLEEYLVNSIQWSLRTGDLAWHRSLFGNLVGEGWEARLIDLRGLLAAFHE